MASKGSHKTNNKQHTTSSPTEKYNIMQVSKLPIVLNRIDSVISGYSRLSPLPLSCTQ
jgi:ubiquitin